MDYLFFTIFLIGTFIQISWHTHLNVAREAPPGDGSNLAWPMYMHTFVKQPATGDPHAVVPGSCAFNTFSYHSHREPNNLIVIQGHAVYSNTILRECSVKLAVRKRIGASMVRSSVFRLLSA